MCTDYLNSKPTIKVLFPRLHKEFCNNLKYNYLIILVKYHKYQAIFPDLS